MAHATLDEPTPFWPKLKTMRRREFRCAFAARCRPQAYEVTVFDAIFHVVEHFSYHTGQIVFAAKWLARGKWIFTTIGV